MNVSLINTSRGTGTPAGAFPSCIYPLGLGPFLDVPLEVIALETEAMQGKSSKWDIVLLLAKGKEDAYINLN